MSENWYGRSCEVFCEPHDDAQGHYTCDKTGSKLCRSGACMWLDRGANELPSSPHMYNMYDGFSISTWIQLYEKEHRLVDIYQNSNNNNNYARTILQVALDEATCMNKPRRYTYSDDRRDCNVSDDANSPYCSVVHASGWSGEVCSVEIDECQSTPCFNDAHCHDKLDRYQCECRIGFTGSAT